MGMLIILVLIFGEIQQVFGQVNFNLKVQDKYIQEQIGTEPLRISSNDVIMAVQLYSLGASNYTFSIEDYVMPYATQIIKGIDSDGEYTLDVI